MNTDDFIKNEDLSDERYNRYRPTIPIRIFGFLTDEDNIEGCEINISTDCSLSKMIPILNDYFEWFKNCKQEMISYFSEKLNEDLFDDWFENIEVYNISVTLNSPDDFGATVSFGESVFPDSIIEFDFEKFKIVDDRLTG